VIDGFWDYNFAHFITDSLARLIRYLDFLLRNQDIRIHVRAHEDEESWTEHKKQKGLIYYLLSFFIIIIKNDK
jgi:hypothetical protein